MLQGLMQKKISPLGEIVNYLKKIASPSLAARKKKSGEMKFFSY